jgi:hypothetical protein
VYGPPPYGGPQYGSPQFGPPRKKTNAPLVASLVVGVLVLAGLGVALLLGLRAADGSAADVGTAADASSSGGIPPSVQRPTDLGNDPAMDRLAEECHGGDMQSCDDLFRESPIGSDYETYGGTCAGRQPVDDARTVYCTDAFPG